MDILERLGLKIGSRMDFLLDNKQSCVSRIEDVAENEFLLLSMPMHRGRPVALNRDEEVTLVYILESGRFGISAKVLGFKREGSLLMAALQTHGQPRRMLLRGAYRLNTQLKALVRDYDFGPFEPVPEGTVERAWIHRSKIENEYEIPVLTHDISESGLSFRSKYRYAKQDKVYVKLWLEWPEPKSAPIIVLGDVRRRDYLNNDDTTYVIGLRYMDLEEETRRILSRFILTKQQEILRRRRRAGGD